MNRKIIFLVIIIIIIFAAIFVYRSFKLKKDSYGCLIGQGYSWCEFKRQCVKEGEGCVLTKEWILGEAKKIVGLDLNVLPDKAIEFNTENGKIAFLSKGIYYLDELKAKKVIESFGNVKDFLQGIGFQADSFNPVTQDENQDLIKYKKDDLICVIGRVDNPNNTSSFSLFCGNPEDKLCNFNASCGRSCQSDNDCALITNGCAKKIVCRTKGIKFYHDCENPTSVVSELDTRITECACLENQCVPKNENLRPNN